MRGIAQLRQQDIRNLRIVVHDYHDLARLFGDMSALVYYIVLGEDEVRIVGRLGEQAAGVAQRRGKFGISRLIQQRAQHTVRSEHGHTLLSRLG